MLLSLNWIRDFVKLPAISEAEITGLITLKTAELDGFQTYGQVLESVLVAEVIRLEPVKNSSLKEAVIDVGGGRTHTVLCGAPNVCIGMKTLHAPVGTKLPDGKTVAVKSIAGVESHGFLCSEAELMLGSDDSGLMVLDSSVANGTKASVVFPDAVDTVIEIDNKSLTHRPDLWCHYGFARELATIFGVDLANPFDQSWRQSVLNRSIETAAPVSVNVDPATCCLGFAWGSIDKVTVSPSPSWLRGRLHRVGIRPINNIVDIGNYVMLELGIPLHLYDRAKIKGSEIRVIPVHAPTSMQLLDGSTAQLQPSDTIIVDDEDPLVLAGITGGARPAVSETTDNLLLEVANWSASAIRKTSLRVGVRTESSLRYEKSLDSTLLNRTAIRALDLITTLCPESRIVGPLGITGLPPKQELPSIQLSLPYLNEILGTSVPPQDVERILTALGFSVERRGDSMSVTVPSYRATKDVSCDMALIEEVGRMWGYERITPMPPQSHVVPVKPAPLKQLQRSIADFMVYRGKALEIVTYPLIGLDLLKRAWWPMLNDELVLQNAWSSDFDRMRPSLIPSALNALALNQKSYESFRFFEIGRSYVPGGDFCQERHEVIFVEFTREQRKLVEALTLVENALSLTHSCDAVLRPLSEEGSSFVPANWEGMLQATAHEVWSPRGVSGVVFEVSPLLSHAMKIRGHASIIVLSLDALAHSATFDQRKFEPINYFPSTSIDLTVSAGARVPVAEVLKGLRAKPITGVVSTSIVSVFPLPDDKKAVTLRLGLQKEGGTFTKEELKSCEQAIISILQSSGFPLRS